MKNFTLLIGALLVSINLMGQDVLNENFDAPTSLDGWTAVADASGRPAEFDLTYNATGGVSGSGAIEFSGTNSDGGGRAYIVQKSFAGLDFSTTPDVDITLDIKGEAVGATANVNLLVQVLGTDGPLSQRLIQTEINNSTFTTVSYSLTGIPSGLTEFFVQFNIATGDAIGDGGSITLDNIVVVPAAGGGGSCTADAADNIDPVGGTLNWSFAEGGETFDPFGGIAASIVDNPSVNTDNETCKVYRVEKTVGCADFAGIGTALTNPIDFNNSTEKVVRLKVYAETEATSVTVQLEREPFPDIAPEVAITQNINATGQWEDLEFDFSGHDDKTFRSFIIYINRGEVCDGDIYYIDEVNVPLSPSGGGGGGSEILAEDFDAPTSIDGWTAVADASGRPAEFDLTYNATGGVSGSGAIEFSGTNSDGGGRAYIVQKSFTGLDFSTTPDVDITLDIKGEAVGATANVNLLVQVLGADGPLSQRQIQTEINNSTFTTVSYSLTGIPSGLTEFFVQFNIATGDAIGDGGNVTLDNIVVAPAGGGGGGDTTPPVISLNGDATVNLAIGDPYVDAGATATDDTDGDLTSSIVVGGDVVDTGVDATYTITYNVTDAAGNAAEEVTRRVIVGTGGETTLLDFENNLAGVTASQFSSDEQLTGQLIANPVSEGINTSPNVYEISYQNTNDWWGGVGFVFADGVLDNQATVYKAKLYSTVAASNVLFEVEQFDGTTSTGTIGNIQTVANANEWVEVTFTISGAPPTGVNRILIRPDIGTDNTKKENTGILYVDDITCVSCGSGGGGGDPDPTGPNLLPNGDFEVGVAQTDWEFLLNNGTIEITDTDQNGGTFSAKLVADVPATTASNPIIQQEGFAIDQVNIGDVVRVSFDIKATTSGDGGVPKAALLSNRAEGAGATRYDIIFTATGDWQTVTQDITIDDLFVSANGLSIQFEAGCGGVTGCGVEMFVDNVSIVSLAAPPAATATFPIDFEVGGTFEEADIANFNGGASTIIDNPDASGLNTSAKVVQMQKFPDQVFGGTTLNLDGSIDYTLSQVFSMTVWSSRVVPVTFKLEFAGSTLEQVVNHTGSSSWEELTFDFSSETDIPETSAITLIFDNGVQGAADTDAANWTFYYDDINQVIIEPEPQVITFDPIADKTLGDAPFNLVASSDSGLDVTFSSTSDKVDVTSAGEVTLLAAGTVTIDADQAGNVEFEAAETVSQTFCINPMTPTITADGEAVVGVTLTSSSTMGNQWFLDGAAINGATNETLVTTSAGDYTVQVTIDGCTSVVSAATAIADPIPPTPQTITFDAISTKTEGDGPFSLSATASSGLTVTFSSNSDKVSIDGAEVTILSAGRVEIDADQPGDDTFEAAETVTQEFCINPMKPVITVNNNNTETVELQSSSNTGNQWFLNGEIITSEDDPTLSVDSEGIYTVQVTVDDCISEISDEIALIVTSTGLAEGSSVFSVFPNPASGIIQIMGFYGESNALELYDLSGRKQQVEFKYDGGMLEADISEIPNGMYLLLIKGEDSNEQVRIIKN